MDRLGPMLKTVTCNVYCKVTRVESGQIVLDQRQAIGLFSSEGKSWVGFWIGNADCDVLRVNARVGKEGEKVTKVIPFACGE